MPALVLVLLVPLLLSCSADLEALYADEQALIALLPARPDYRVAARCGMCALQNCEQERLECEHDELCSELLSCKAPCDNPACLLECEAEHAAGGEHNNFHTCLFDDCAGDPDCMSECEAEHRARERYDAYSACVFEDECRNECATGENWQCLGDFSWKPSGAGQASSPGLAIMLRQVDSPDPIYPGATQVRVYACLSSDNCASRDEKDSDSFGVAVFEELPLDDDGAFQGYFRFLLDEFDEEGIRHIHDIGRPVHRQITMEEPVMTKSQWREQIHNFMGDTPLQTAGHIAARVVDCLDAPAVGISFSLPPDRVGLPFYNTNAEYGAPGTETNKTGMGGFGNLEGIASIASVKIKAVRSSDGTLVSEREIEIRGGTITRVDLYPLDRESSEGSGASQ